MPRAQVKSSQKRFLSLPVMGAMAMSLSDVWWSTWVVVVDVEEDVGTEARERLWLAKQQQIRV